MGAADRHLAGSIRGVVHRSQAMMWAPQLSPKEATVEKFSQDETVELLLEGPDELFSSREEWLEHYDQLDSDHQGEVDAAVQQDEIAAKLCEEIETLEPEESDELYDQLDRDHKNEVDAAAREFADNAVGDEHWDTDR